MTVKCTTVLMMDNLYETRSTPRILDLTDVIRAFMFHRSWKARAWLLVRRTSTTKPQERLRVK